jgi:protein-tyrosine phosphatase
MLSFVQKLIIEIQRTTDQTWRKVTGLPTLKRSMITPHLFLGGQYANQRLASLKKIGITGIVNMRMTSVSDKTLLKGFQYIHLPTADQKAPSLENLHKGVLFIDDVLKNKGKVYVHCREGEGRGPTMVIAYLIYKGMNFDDAITTVKKVRTFIRPTLAQITQLKKFEQRHL